MCILIKLSDKGSGNTGTLNNFGNWLFVIKVQEMADELMYDMLLKMLENLPTFSGKRNEDVIQWLEEITYGFNCAQFNDDQKVSIVSKYIKDAARIWLIHNMFILSSWSTFIQTIKEMFGPVLIVNEIVIDDDKEMKEVQKYELEQEDGKGDKKEEETCFSTAMGDVNKAISTDTYVKTNGTGNVEMNWSDGDESWFIHNELNQRPQFIACEQQKVSCNLSTNIDNELSQEKLTSTENGVLSCGQRTEIRSSLNVDQVFNKLLQLHEFCSGVISFILLLDSLLVMQMAYHPNVNGYSCDRYFCRNVMWSATEDRDWFRSLAVP